jgi:hypothetical protein
MATIKGVLGQAAPNATTEADLYTVPASKNATVKVICTNRSTETTVRVSVGVNGASTDNTQYVAYDTVLSANNSLATATLMLGSADVVRVYAGSANVSFTCTGLEQDD